MATVYLADDLKHERSVALKVLKPELAAVVGGERFLAEIKTTANLQHPHILPLFDSGEADSFLFYVMPYIEGETLRDRLDREKQLPIDEALGIAIAVANALHTAHEAGIVHRDIKPANILLSRGEPLVADFGIALAVGAAGGSRLTETGLSVGTPYYMSPEQATGDQVIGATSDTYALACVLYEMLVGDPPYVGSTAQAVLGKIIQGAPVSPTESRHSIPPNVDAAIRKALEKLPADRFAGADQFAKALSDPSFRHGEPSAAEASASSVGVWRWLGPASVGVAAVLAVLTAWGWMRPEPPATVARFGLAFPVDQDIIDLPAATTFAVAPDGSAIAYAGPGESGLRQLWVKLREQLEPQPLPGTDGVRGPVISPDGSSVIFEQVGRLRLSPLQGGAAITLADSARTFLAWLGDDEVLFTHLTYRIGRVSASGGASELVTTRESGRYHFAPSSLPSKRGFLYTSCDANCVAAQELWVHDLDTGESKLVVTGALRGWYLHSGHVVFVRPDGAVFALPFDLGSLESTGPAFPVLEGVKIDGFTPDLDITADGFVLMMTGSSGGLGPNQEVVWVTRDGTVRPVDPAWRMQSARNRGWTLSPDGSRLAIALNTVEGDDIWVKELDDGPLLRLTDDPAEDARPYWSRDGELIYFLGRRRDGVSDLYVRRADGADEVRPVLAGERSLWELTWTPDDEWMVARAGGRQGEQGSRNIVAYHMGGDSAEVELLTSEYDAVAPKLSPDGRWLAYASEESGQWEVYVRPFPDVTSGRTVVSRGGGNSPLWAHHGREIFYISSDGQMMSAAVEAGSVFRVTERSVLFDLPAGSYVSPLSTAYDITPDDEQFILVRSRGVGLEERAPLVLIENWLEEVKERAGG
jgi:serine/threonine-protein kinase